MGLQRGSAKTRVSVECCGISAGSSGNTTVCPCTRRIQSSSIPSTCGDQQPLRHRNFDTNHRTHHNNFINRSQRKWSKQRPNFTITKTPQKTNQKPHTEQFCVLMWKTEFLPVSRHFQGWDKILFFPSSIPAWGCKKYSSCREKSRNCFTGSVIKIKTLLLKLWLHNMVLKHSQTKLVQKYHEVFAFVFKTCWLRELMKKGISTEATKKTTHKLTNWMEIISLQLCLQKLLPQICWATQKPVEYYITKYLCIHQISQQRHVQVPAKGSTQHFPISHQISPE